MRALALAALLPLAAAAQEPPRYKPFYEVAFADGADVGASSKVLKNLKTVHGDWAGLVTPQIVKKVLFMPSGFGDAKYCWNPDAGIVNHADEGCVGEHMTVLADPELLLSFEEKFPGFHRPGTAVQAVLFHELMHGWAYAHPADLERYAKTVSSGRRIPFERRHQKLMGPIRAIEDRLEDARKRVAMGDMTREQWKAQGGTEFEQAILDDQWATHHDAMTLPQAQASLEKYEAKLSEVAAKIGAKIARYNERKKIPGRGDRDIHATENDQEWWAYGAEIYFYGAEPGKFLNKKELAWWAALAPELKGGSRAPAAVSDRR